MALFITIAFVAIILGGVLSAFSARRPSRFVMWVVAYLVLVAGSIQAGLAIGWYLLELPFSALAVTGFVLFNLGNAAVIAGRWLKGRVKNARFIVYTGGALLGAASLTLGILTLSAEWSWSLVLFLMLIVVVLVSMPIGLFLSTRPHKAPAHK